MNTEIAAYNPTKAALADLTTRYKGLVFDVRTPKGMTDAKAAYKEINTHSLALEAARMKIEEEQRQERLARQAREEVERVKRQEEEARLKAERDKIEAERRAVEEVKRKEQAAAEAKARAIRDAEEANQREIRRKKAEQEDARGMLLLWRERYGHLPEYAAVVAAIDSFLVPA